METSGPESEVVKLLPALTITPEELDEGLQIIAGRGDRRRRRTEHRARTGADTSHRRGASTHRDRPIVQGHRGHRPACDGRRPAPGSSKRIVLAKERVGFSLHETILYAGTETSM